MVNKFLCVMAGYDSNTEKILANMQMELYKKGYCGEHTKDLPQHLTLYLRKGALGCNLR